MTQVQLQGLLLKREQMLRARKEYEHAKLMDTHYRGVRTLTANPKLTFNPKGKRTYRGVEYVK